MIIPVEPLPEVRRGGGVGDQVVVPPHSGLANRKETLDELSEMIAIIKDLDLEFEPDVALRVTAALMARCTEIYVEIIRIENQHRSWKTVRTQQVVKVMELVDFTYKAASRYIEFRRQEVEMSH